MAEVHAHLEATVVPLRLAVVSASGHPQVVSLWYLWRDDALWCATLDRSRVARWLQREPRCGFEVARDAPPYRGVRGCGRAVLEPALGGEILGLLLDRYLGSRETPLARWLLSRASREVAVQIAPERLASWDFSDRMSADVGAVGRG
jgi:nitroimidazol reductase NimA-like FMN-containing flavoprotein (pyridoxamine 5'-phosphate oxidase superfamily)